ncbi:MAG: hypothetical protein AB2693_02660 [Candidatus Thiodiazotropha sp.]
MNQNNDNASSNNITIESDIGDEHNEHEHTLNNEQTNNYSNILQNLKLFSISTLNIQGLSKYEDDVRLKEFVSQFDMIGLCETWGKEITEFSGFVEGYISFTDIRPKKRYAIRGSGGITVLVKELLVSENIVKRICTDLKECVVLLLDGSKFVNQSDVIFFFTYVAPQYSSYYSNSDENGIDILAEKKYLQ